MEGESHGDRRMMRTVSIIALIALSALLSGCGCSREKKPVEGVEARMKDAEYTNRLAEIRSEQVKVASAAAAIRSEIEKLGGDAERHASYPDLTNRLAQCEADMERIRKTAQQTVRERILRDSPEKKGYLKK